MSPSGLERKRALAWARRRVDALALIVAEREEAPFVPPVEDFRATEGYIVLGYDELGILVGAVVENEASFGFAADRARLWRARPGDESGARAAAERQCARFTDDPLLRHGRRYAVFDIDEDACPIVLDWLALREELSVKTPRYVRGRRDRSKLRNLPLVSRLDPRGRLLDELNDRRAYEEVV